MNSLLPRDLDGGSKLFIMTLLIKQLLAALLHQPLGSAGGATDANGRDSF